MSISFDTKVIKQLGDLVNCAKVDGVQMDDNEIKKISASSGSEPATNYKKRNSFVAEKPPIGGF